MRNTRPHKCTGTTGRDLCNAAWLKECVDRTRSFEHISGEVIKGWLLGRAELEEFGQHERSNYETPYYYDMKCEKCKGRGWFGRGRPTCDVCDGVGRDAGFSEGKWRERRRFSGTAKRRWMHIVHHSFRRREPEYLRVFHDAMERTVKVEPDWIKDLELGGAWSKSEKERIIRRIRESVTQDVSRPSVRVPDKIKERIAWSGMRPDNIPGFKISESLVRLALTFGCTCPVTGEFVSPEDVFGPVLCWNEEPERYINPLGFREDVFVDNWRTGYKKKFSVSPLSRKGEDAINRAVAKWNRSNSGKVVNEWVLAEVMKTQILKRVA